MKSSEIQSKLSALMAASADVNQFAPFIVEDDTSDNESIIDVALEAKGACVAIDDIEGAENESAASNTRAKATTQASILIYEQPNVTHSPARLLLIEAVVGAIIKTGEFKLVGFTRFRREKGGVVCVADFSADVIF